MTETDDKWTHQKRETKTLPIHNKEQCFDMSLSSNLKLNDHRKLKKKKVREVQQQYYLRNGVNYQIPIFNLLICLKTV